MSKLIIPAALLLLAVATAALCWTSYEQGRSYIAEPAATNVEAEPIGNNIWVTDDHVRGVSCYRSAQSGGTLSCVKVK